MKLLMERFKIEVVLTNFSYLVIDRFIKEEEEEDDDEYNFDVNNSILQTASIKDEFCSDTEDIKPPLLE